MSAETRKKVLIITYYWPPSGGSGVLRWLKFVKYIRPQGWEPIIFTHINGEYQEVDETNLLEIPKNVQTFKNKIWEPYNVYKKIVGQKKEQRITTGFISEKKKPGLIENFSIWVRGNVFIPDARRFWIKPSIRFLLKKLKSVQIDAMISNGPPHSTHLIALGLKKKLAIPWIADFRDPWTNIDFYQDLKLTKWADNKNKKLEKKVLTAADMVTTVSWNWAEGLRKNGADKVTVIPNGFDPEDYIGLPEKPNEKFIITHIGTVNRDRNPKTLWIALKELIDEGKIDEKDLVIRFIGMVDHTVFQSLNENQLDQFLEKTDFLEHKEALKKLAESPIVLLLINNAPNQGGIIPGKVFEYLASKRPILVIGPKESDISKIINETNSGTICEFDDKETMKSILVDFYKKHKKNGIEKMNSNIDAFSKKKQIGDIVELINEIS